LILSNRRRISLTAPILLICNTHASVMYICLVLLDMYAHNLYGDVYGNISFDNSWCYLRAYFLHVGLATLYHSYLLQALFRYFRIIYFKLKRLQSVQFIFQLVLLQWSIDFLYMASILIPQHFRYISGYYYCQISYYNLPGLLISTCFVYYVPMFGITLIYLKITCYMKKKRGVLILQNRQRSNQRDFIVLCRILTLIGILFLLSFPSTLLWMSYFVTGYLYPFIYHFQWLTYVFSLSILPTISVVLTPHLRTLLIYE
jgi:hypothetical protein